jgi:nucleotide-binding universal stress UspA family protein
VQVKDVMSPTVEISSPSATLERDSPTLAGQTLMRVSSRPDRAPGFRRILVALDGSKFAERVLPSVESLAQKFGSTVILIQAVTPIEDPAPAEASLGVVSDDWPTSQAAPITDEMRVHAESYLTSVRKALEARGLAVETDCPEGKASEVILHQARRIGADLIAITTHGRTGVDRMLFGSVAEEVLHRAPCPVLLLRVKGH